MDTINNIFGGTNDIFGITWIFFIKGGWVLLVLTFIFMLYQTYRYEITHQWVAEQEWIFLTIRVPKENLASTLAIENIYSQIHALHTSLSFTQRVIEGRIQLWFSLEIISLGGQVSMVIMCPKKSRDLVEAAFYAQYPQSEIVEVEDYMKHITYDPDTSDFELWGSDFKLLEDDVIPIKTYRDFEHPTAEEKIIDPMAPTFEALAKMQPWEFYGIQIIIQPLADPEWRPRGEAKVKDLMGKGEHESHWYDIIFFPVQWFANIGRGTNGHGDEEVQPPKFHELTELEKERITGVQRKISKPGYKTKVRHLYISPKEKYDGSKKQLLIGAFRNLGSAMLNGFKPDTKKTWTGVDPKVSPSLESAYIKYEQTWRKRWIFKAYKERDWHVGIPQYILNVEEIATLFHLPIYRLGTSAQPPVEQVSMKKSQAPVNLPVGDYE